MQLQSIFVKENIIPNTQILEGYTVLVHNPENKQCAVWNTNLLWCSLDTNFFANPSELSMIFTENQGYSKVDLEFILGDRFKYAYQNKVVLSTTKRITGLLQRLIISPSIGLLDDVMAYKQEYLVTAPGVENDLRDYAHLGDALKDWFKTKVPDTDNIWFNFLRDILKCVDWQMVAQEITLGSWLSEPKIDQPVNGCSNFLTWSVHHYVGNSKKELPKLQNLAKRYNNAESLADELQDWFVKHLPHSVVRRDIFSQLMLEGIHCVDWLDIAESLLPDSEEN
jgi:hypothetical protein